MPKALGDAGGADVLSIPPQRGSNAAVFAKGR
jgi:hypothetical protein